MKKILKALILSSIMTIAATMSAMAEEAIPTASTVLVNGSEVKFDAYNINGNNYFKLRDIAYALSDTNCKFDVSYDAEVNAISLITGKEYTIAGGEMAKSIGVNRDASLTDSKIIKDGEDVTFTAYNINGNNYFKLRDVGNSFGFAVDWHEEDNSIIIDTRKEVDNMDGDYFSTLNVGDRVELIGAINQIRPANGWIDIEDYHFIVGDLTSDENDCVVVLHLQDGAAYGQITDYEPYEGKTVSLTGTYEGYSNLYNKPCVSLYEMLDVDTSDTVKGLRKQDEELKQLADGRENLLYGAFRNLISDIIIAD